MEVDVCENPLELRYRSRLSNNRKILAKIWLKQSGLCCWCGKLTMIPGFHSKQSFLREISVDPINANRRFFRRRYATKEHIIPKSVGGVNSGNIVCACADCNSRRGADSSMEFHPSVKLPGYAFDALDIARKAQHEQK